MRCVLSTLFSWGVSYQFSGLVWRQVSYLHRHHHQKNNQHTYVYIYIYIYVFSFFVYTMVGCVQAVASILTQQNNFRYRCRICEEGICFSFVVKFCRAGPDCVLAVPGLPMCFGVRVIPGKGRQMGFFWRASTVIASYVA